jgi:hypothetical protein
MTVVRIAVSFLVTGWCIGTRQPRQNRTPAASAYPLGTKKEGGRFAPTL